MNKNKSDLFIIHYPVILLPLYPYDDAYTSPCYNHYDIMFIVRRPPHVLYDGRHTHDTTAAI